MLLLSSYTITVLTIWSTILYSSEKCTCLLLRCCSHLLNWQDQHIILAPRALTSASVGGYIKEEIGAVGVFNLLNSFGVMSVLEKLRLRAHTNTLQALSTINFLVLSPCVEEVRWANTLMRARNIVCTGAITLAKSDTAGVITGVFPTLPHGSMVTVSWRCKVSSTKVYLTGIR